MSKGKSKRKPGPKLQKKITDKVRAETFAKVGLSPEEAPEPAPVVDVGGRPTEYREDFPQRLIDHMSQGLSFETFAALANVTRKTLYEWVHRHDAFRDAKGRGEVFCQLWWEKVGNGAALGKIQHFKSSAYNMNMVNRFGWQHRISTEITGKDGGPIQTETTHKGLVEAMKQALEGEEPEDGFE